MISKIALTLILATRVNKTSALNLEAGEINRYSFEYIDQLAIEEIETGKFNIGSREDQCWLREVLRPLRYYYYKKLRCE